MNICLNGIYFAPGKIGGVETYFRELIQWLPVIGRDDTFTVAVGKQFCREFSPAFNLIIKEVSSYQRPDPRWFINSFLRRAMGLGIDLHARSLNKIDADVIHYPFTTLSPYNFSKPSILTFWDMQHEFYPDFFSLSDRIYRSRTYKKSALQATRIIVSSSFTKQCLEEYYGIDAGKIDVIHTGYSSVYKVISENADNQRIRDKYKLDSAFMFYPAATWPHKNHIKLIDALKIIVDNKNFDGVLALSGISMKHNNEVINKIISYKLEKHVRILGYVPTNELPYLYNMARFLIFPSLFEGFGIPLVEAMACGCPVLASNCTSIPEVMGDAGKLFDPSSAEGIAEAISSVWNNDTSLASMRELGLQRVKSFMWEATARKTLDVYRKAIN